MFEGLLGGVFLFRKDSGYLFYLIISSLVLMCVEFLLSLHCSGNEVYMDDYLSLSRRALVSEMVWYFPACLEISFLPIFLLKYQIQVSTLKNISRMITVVSLSKFFISLQNWVFSFVLSVLWVLRQSYFTELSVSLNLRTAAQAFCQVSVLGLKLSLFFFVVEKNMMFKLEAKVLFCRINNYPDIICHLHMWHKFCENRARWVIVLKNPGSVFSVYFSNNFSWSLTENSLWEARFVCCELASLMPYLGWQEASCFQCWMSQWLEAKSFTLDEMVSWVSVYIRTFYPHFSPFHVTIWRIDYGKSITLLSSS